MAGPIRYLWNDSVWSKVIGAALFAALSWVASVAHTSFGETSMRAETSPGVIYVIANPDSNAALCVDRPPFPCIPETEIETTTVLR